MSCRVVVESDEWNGLEWDRLDGSYSDNDSLTQGSSLGWREEHSGAVVVI